MTVLGIGSLFSGVGGIELGSQTALRECGYPAETVYQVEADPLCRRVLERYPDVREVDPRALPKVEVLVGGFPCQDLSAAGRKAGIEAGKRSSLWRDFARIVDYQRPAIVIVENVNQTRQRWLPTVFRDLGGLGYTCRAYRVAASDVGAPHERARAFAIAHADRESLRLLAERMPRRREGGVRRPWEAQPGEHGRPWLAALASYWATPPALHRMDDGLPRKLDEARLRMHGNAVVPQVAYVVMLEAIRIFEQETAQANGHVRRFARSARPW